MINKPYFPKVSIGIPTYNGSARISKALNSIWRQNYPNLEIIVSDNCSTDETPQVIAAAQQEHPEIIYFRQGKNIGLVPNFEFVLKMSSGEYFMWIGDDDALEPGALSNYVSFLERHPEYSLVSGAVQYWKGNKHDLVEKDFSMEQNNRCIRTIAFYFKVIYGGMFHGMMRRTIAAEIPCRNVFGNDYHFIASVAFTGKMKNFDWTGYHKWFGGTSRDNRIYARSIGESKFTGNYPHLKMAFDAFLEVYTRSQVFRSLGFLPRIITAFSSSLGILYCYYITIFPFKIGGIVKRGIGVEYIMNTVRLKINK